MDTQENGLSGVLHEIDHNFVHILFDKGKE